jgi:hypothetical protein
MAGNFSAQPNFRGGSPMGMNNPSIAQRGSFGSEQNPSMSNGQPVLSSSLPGNPHSSRGFRKALERTQRSGSKLKDQLPDKTSFGNKGFRKPNYFAQGGGRHGMHIGSGAPFTGPATGDAGSGFGGGE